MTMLHVFFNRQRLAAGPVALARSLVGCSEPGRTRKIPSGRSRPAPGLTLGKRFRVFWMAPILRRGRFPSLTWQVWIGCCTAGRRLPP